MFPGMFLSLMVGGWGGRGSSLLAFKDEPGRPC